MTTPSFPPHSVVSQLQQLSQVQFSGRVQIEAETSQVEGWNLYFCLGRLVWATGGSHPIRRLHRLLNQFCPQSQAAQELPATAAMRCWDYHFLTFLVRRQRITREQVVAIIDQTVGEVLFDVLQAEANGLTVITDRQESLDTPLTVINVEVVRQRAEEAWLNWQQAGLADRSPDLALWIARPELLREQVSPAVFDHLSLLLDGKRSLRELGVVMQQDVLLVARSLLPYVSKGILVFTPVKDPQSTSQPTPREATDHTALYAGSLVACIDDSPTVCETMRTILTQAGYRFLGIQDSTQVLPTLLDRKPDLIFLDLIMPVANGYELCAQIRRMSAFKNTPIVILTGNDGIIDRMRAKMVGSTDFVAKPIDSQQVLQTLAKHLKQQPPASLHSTSISSLPTYTQATA
ncbi:MAG: response regulator [Cyanobacteriota bacterium]|nr:response regulator [Cyanobacteriota bacterium]